MVKDSNNVWECTRSAVGLAVENIMVGLFFIDVDLDIPDREADFADLLEMIDDLDGVVCTTRTDQSETNPFMKNCGLADICNRLPEYDIVVCF